MPWMITFSLFPGTFTDFRIFTTVPIWYSSAVAGFSVFGSRWATMPSSLSGLARACSTACTDWSRPTLIGNASTGKMTVFRIARTGTSRTGGRLGVSLSVGFSKAMWILSEGGLDVT